MERGGNQTTGGRPSPAKKLARGTVQSRTHSVGRSHPLDLVRERVPSPIRPRAPVRFFGERNLAASILASGVVHPCSASAAEEEAVVLVRRICMLIIRGRVGVRVVLRGRSRGRVRGSVGWVVLDRSGGQPVGALRGTPLRRGATVVSCWRRGMGRVGSIGGRRRVLKGRSSRGPDGGVVGGHVGGGLKPGRSAGRGRLERVVRLWGRHRRE